MTHEIRNLMDGDGIGWLDKSIKIWRFLVRYNKEETPKSNEKLC